MSSAVRCLRRQKIADAVSIALALSLGSACADPPRSAERGSVHLDGAAAIPESVRVERVDPTVASAALFGNRAYAAYTWDTLWQLHGTFDDTLLLQPVQLHAQDSLLFVADHANGNIQAFLASSGQRVWTRGRRGQGPNEFTRMSVFAAYGNRIGVADAVNQRVTYLTPSGEFDGESRVTFPAGIYGVCEINGRRFVSGSRNGVPRIMEWDLETDTLLERRPEWFSYVDTLDRIRGQFVLRRAGVAHCALRHSLGPYDLLLFDAELQLTARVAPREPVAPAVVETMMYGERVGFGVGRNPAYGWQHMGTVGNSLFVSFTGSSTYADRLIEEFTLPDLSYVGTHLAPHPVRSLAGDLDRLAVLMQDTSGYYLIAQLRRNKRQE